MKRIIDFSFSLLMIIAASPIMLIISVIIFFSLGRPIIFKQERVGLNEKIFILYKFRTMKTSHNENGVLPPDSNRLTKVGSVLRKLSLDELPQLVNILKGEMSLVGPRPLLIQYLPYYSERERLRHTVKPGVTGLAQVSGRNKLTWDERLELDAKYVEEQDLVQDIKILIKTILKVFLREDIVVDPRALMKDLNEERKEMLKD
ncbi:sugar transferase [Bacillus sp. HMSC76G11]|nr:sugar transferase [Metabacillus idriensis]OHR68134.1 sugar transferase [Bacillus sp. HMSC76G11]